MKNPFTFRGWLIVVAILAFGILIAFGAIQSCRVNDLENELKRADDNDQYFNNKIETEKRIMKDLDTKGPDELSTMACNAFQ